MSSKITSCCLSGYHLSPPPQDTGSGFATELSMSLGSTVRMPWVQNLSAPLAMDKLLNFPVSWCPYLLNIYLTGWFGKLKRQCTYGG